MYHLRISAQFRSLARISCIMLALLSYFSSHINSTVHHIAYTQGVLILWLIHSPLPSQM